MTKYIIRLLLLIALLMSIPKSLYSPTKPPITAKSSKKEIISAYAGNIYYLRKSTGYRISLIKKVIEKCRKYGLNHLLILGLIYVESRGKWYATSPSGAIGYMQVMPFHYRGPKKHLYAPGLNIEKGTWYFKKRCIKRHKSIKWAISAYHNGHNSKRFNRVYVSAVLKAYKKICLRLYSNVRKDLEAHEDLLVQNTQH